MGGSSVIICAPVWASDVLEENRAVGFSASNEQAQRLGSGRHPLHLLRGVGERADNVPAQPQEQRQNLPTRHTKARDARLRFVTFILQNV